jgi:DNA repair protein RecN (Recombination protein N)
VLTQLKVSNYALIDELDLSFSNGFTAITGETGSGKSIMLGALGMVLGERVDTNALRDKDRKCVVEASFLLDANKFTNFFTSHDLDFETETVLRREINKSGKSRAFINDTPVNLSQLKSLTSKLIDIHSQHQTLLIQKSEFQLSIVDSYAKSSPLLEKYQSQFEVWQLAKTKLKDLEQADQKSKSDYDYIQFQFNEIDEIKIEGINLIELETELELLSNSEELKGLAIELNEELSGEDAVLTKLANVKAIAQKLAAISQHFHPLSERLNSAILELEDLSGDFEIKSNDLQHDPGRVKVVSESVNDINRLLFKHHLTTTEELALIKAELERKLKLADSLDQDIEKAKNHLNEALALLLDCGEALSVKRKSVADELAMDLKDLVAQLSMEHATFKFELSKSDNPGPLGVDDISTLVKLNKGGSFLPIDKSASGGELGRIMLSLKVILSEGTSIPTIIFDEIDTGVSGEVANKMADLLARISSGLQLICISHLPQIASKGQQHFKVYKSVTENSTTTEIVLLNKDQRLLEIAEMLSGKDPSDAAVQNARELLN